jgi:hypothetical protein
MTTAPTTQPTSTLTASVFLFGEGDEGVQALARALDEQGVVASLRTVLTKLSGPGLRAVGDQVAVVAHGLLDIDLGDLLSAGWRRFDDLVDAARRTVSSPGTREVVDLVTHTISSSHHPHVELLVDDVVVARLGLDLDLAFTVKGAVATVHGGRMVALHTGDCYLVGTLSAQGKELAAKDRTMQLPLLLALGDGIPLLGAGAVARATAPGQVRTTSTPPE